MSSDLDGATLINKTLAPRLDYCLLSHVFVSEWNGELRDWNSWQIDRKNRVAQRHMDASTKLV